MAKAPEDANVKNLQSRAADLEKRLAEFKDKNRALESRLTSQGKTLPEESLAYADLEASHAELQQQFKAEKLKVGELQIEITELKNRLGQDSDADTLYRQIKTLQEDKKKLEIQLANILDNHDGENASTLDKRGMFSASGDGFNTGMRNMIIYLLVTLVLGLGAGAYLMDLLNRRRHGGFRV